MKLTSTLKNISIEALPSMILATCPFIEYAYKLSPVCLIFPLIIMVLEQHRPALNKIIKFADFGIQLILILSCTNLYFFLMNLLNIHENRGLIQYIALIVYYVYMTVVSKKLENYVINTIPHIALLISTIIKNIGFIGIVASIPIFIIALILLFLESNKPAKNEKPNIEKFLEAQNSGQAVYLHNSKKWAFINAALKSTFFNTQDLLIAENKLNYLLEKINDASKAQPNDPVVIVIDKANLSNSNDLDTLSHPPIIDSNFNNSLNLRDIFVIPTPITWNNDPAIIYAFYDITNLVTEAKLKSAYTEKSRILHSLSHEIRTPINATIHSLDECKNLIGKTGNKQILENIDIAMCSTSLLLNKYNDFLVFFCFL